MQGKVLDTKPWHSFNHGVSDFAAGHLPTRPTSRITDITADIRKREHTASDSETESPRARLRARSPQSSPPRTHLTSHVVPSGPGWQEPGGERDGLDEMINGMVAHEVRCRDPC
jgi:hypothetical protein